MELDFGVEGALISALARGEFSDIYEVVSEESLQSRAIGQRKNAFPVLFVLKKITAVTGAIF